MKKKSRQKSKKFSISLPIKDVELLNLYASEQGVTKGVAIRRIIKEKLKEYKPKLGEVVDEKQLCLFDSVQVDIFNNTLKVK